MRKENPIDQLFQVYEERFKPDDSIRQLVTLKAEDIGIRSFGDFTGYIPLEMSANELVDICQERGLKVSKEPENYLLLRDIFLRNKASIQVARGKGFFQYAVIGENPLSDSNAAYVGDVFYKFFVHALNNGEMKIGTTNEND